MAIIKKFRIKSYKKNKPLLAVKDINMSFEKRKILENLTFEINKGEIVGMLGANGVGKSTIINIICGLINPDKGDIFINGQKVNDIPIFTRTSKYNLSVCPQWGGYFFDLSTVENLKAVGEIRVKNQRERGEKIEYLISRFDLEEVRDIRARLLSGGQKRRLTIAMCLVGDPELLLLDEPFSFLDIRSILNIQEIIVNLQSENRITCVITDHQAAALLKICDQSFVLSNGKVIAKGTPSELVKNPNAQSAYFGDSFKIN
tara:strand:+ start:164 stop:940 length:777 start_codon:yes stop_codon:yes gene_type:complete